MGEREKQSKSMSPTVFEAEVIEESINGKGYFVLPKGTRAVLTEVIGNEEGTDYTMKRLGLITLKSPLEVKVPMRDIVSQEPLKGASKSTMTVNFMPSSEQLRAAEREFQKLDEAFYDARGIDPWDFNPWDVPDEATAKERDKIDVQEEKLETIETKLALDILEGREELLKKHGLEKNQVGIIVLSVSIPAFEIEKPSQKLSPWIAVPIDVYRAKLSKEIARENQDKEGK
jgi:hypothetical protein